VASESAALLAMIERAARDPSVDISRMERLFQMHEAAEARHARTAFHAAMANMQSDLPAAARRGTGHNSKKYARFEDVIEALRPIFRTHGFSLTFRIQQSETSITIVGILAHALGHSECTEIVLPADTSGNKNPVQAWASSVSYGKRYVALALTGIATDDDNDAQTTASAASITPDQVKELALLISSTEADLEWMLKHHSVKSISDMTAKDYQQAKAGLMARKRKLAESRA
jgi:hypothetical protein